MSSRRAARPEAGIVFFASAAEVQRGGSINEKSDRRVPPNDCTSGEPHPMTKESKKSVQSPAAFASRFNTEIKTRNRERRSVSRRLAAAQAAAGSGRNDLLPPLELVDIRLDDLGGANVVCVSAIPRISGRSPIPLPGSAIRSRS